MAQRRVKQVLLHIGQPKSGTSTLQRTFRNSRYYLNKFGILYPRHKDVVSVAHHMLAIAACDEFSKLPKPIRTNEDYSEDNVDQKFDVFWARVMRQVERFAPECVILSSETLFSEFEQLDRLRDRLADLADYVQVVAYVRSPAGYYLSSLQQNLKRTSQIRKPPNTDKSRKTIEAYRKIFGLENVHVRPFAREAMIGGDVVADFCASFLQEYGIDADSLVRDGDRNVTLSAESMMVLYWYMTRFHGDAPPTYQTARRGSYTLLKALAAIDSKLSAGRPRLKAYVKRAIDYSSRDLIWLRDELGITFSGIDYDAIVPEKIKLPDDLSLDEIIFVDDNTLDAIVRELSGSDWPNGEAARLEWLKEVSAQAAGRCQPAKLKPRRNTAPAGAAN